MITTYSSREVPNDAFGRASGPQEALHNLHDALEIWGSGTPRMGYAPVSHGVFSSLLPHVHAPVECPCISIAQSRGDETYPRCDISDKSAMRAALQSDIPEEVPAREMVGYVWNVKLSQEQSTIRITHCETMRLLKWL